MTYPSLEGAIIEAREKGRHVILAMRAAANAAAASRAKRRGAHKGVAR